MKSNTTSFCGLDLQRENVTIVQFSTEENAVTLIALQPLSPGSSRDTWLQWESQLAAMKDRLKSFSRNIVCGLPSEFAQIKKCRIDSSTADWREAVTWELSQQLLGLLEDYSFDFEPEQKEENGGKNYLAVAYRKSLVERTAAMIRNARLQPRIIDLDIFGLINIFEANYPENRNDLAVLVHAERELTKLALTEEGKFRDFMTFEHSDEETYPDELQRRIDTLLSPAGKSGDGAGQGVFLAGSYFSAPARRDPVLEIVNGSLMLDPFRKIPCQAAIDKHQLSEFAPQLAVAVGLALRGKE